MQNPYGENKEYQKQMESIFPAAMAAQAEQPTKAPDHHRVQAQAQAMENQQNQMENMQRLQSVQAQQAHLAAMGRQAETTALPQQPAPQQPVPYPPMQQQQFAPPTFDQHGWNQGMHPYGPSQLPQRNAYRGLGANNESLGDKAANFFKSILGENWKTIVFAVGTIAAMYYFKPQIEEFISKRKNPKRRRRRR